MAMTFLKNDFFVGIFIDSSPQLPKIIQCATWSQMYRIIQMLILSYDLPNERLAFIEVKSAGREFRTNDENHEVPSSEPKGLHAKTHSSLQHSHE